MEREIAAPVSIIADRLARGRAVVLTGAGCSTESGIPDYRGPETARRARNPIQFKGFVSTPEARERYWSRSLHGWPLIRDAAPNAAHLALAALEHAGHIHHLITQNVDRLHHKAGSRAFTELHGALADVRCLTCNARVARDDLQFKLLQLNPSWSAARPAAPAPDGDADLLDGAGAGFVVPSCDHCGGVLKPDVVFFGEAVPPDRVATARDAVDAASSLLVVGSSLAVYSGLRFVRQAHARGIPTTLLNLGPPARGAEFFDTIVDASAGAALTTIARVIGALPRDSSVGTPFQV
jgi:NAD-dependent SIR2 family protein deacetylase